MMNCEKIKSLMYSNGTKLILIGFINLVLLIITSIHCLISHSNEKLPYSYFVWMVITLIILALGGILICLSTLKVNNQDE